MALRKHGTLVASTPTTVTLDAPADVGLADTEISEVTVINRGGSGADDLFFTTNGSTPTINGDDTYAVGIGGFVTVLLENTVETLDVKLQSQGTPRFSIETSTINKRR